MSAAEWIAKRRELLDAATEGEWAYGTPGDDMASVTVGDYLASFSRNEDGPATSLWLVWQDGSAHPVISPAITGDGPASAENAALIADARTSLPLALDALEAVLDLAREWEGSSDLLNPSLRPYTRSGRLRAAIEIALRGDS